MKRSAAKPGIRRQKPRPSVVKKHQIALVWEIVILVIIVAAIAAIGYYGWR